MPALAPSNRIARLATVTALLACAAATAYAHVPALEASRTDDKPALIAGPDVSRATYGYLSPTEPQDDYVFVVKDAVTTEVGIIVPAYAEHADFRPTLLIRAEGQPLITISDPQTVPRASEWEPFSLTSFWKGGEQAIEFLPGRRYVMRVEPGGTRSWGRYVIVFGGPEQFEPQDIAATVRQLPIIWFGAYGGAPFRLNPLALIPLGVLALVVGLLVLGVVRAARRRSTRTPAGPVG